MAEDLMQIVRTFLLPEIQRKLDAVESRTDAKFAGLDSHFDAIHMRFDRLETEYQMPVVGVKRVRT